MGDREPTYILVGSHERSERRQGICRERRLRQRPEGQNQVLS